MKNILWINLPAVPAQQLLLIQSSVRNANDCHAKSVWMLKVETNAGIVIKKTNLER